MAKSYKEDKKAPSLQFYPKDALDIKVIRMSDSAQGVYWRLLFNIWSHTETQFSIKNCTKSLSKILGLSSTKWKKYFKEIQQEGDPIFIEEKGMLISKRLRIEKLKQNEWREKSRQGGIKSAQIRAGVVEPPLQPHLQPPNQPKGNTSSSSSSSGENIKEIYKEKFEIFRKAYPGTKNGLDTEYANFKKKNKNYKEITDLLLPAIEKQIIIHNQKIKDKVFCRDYKNLQTWINQHCWEEEEGETSNNNNTDAETDDIPFKTDDEMRKEDADKWVAVKKEYADKLAAAKVAVQ